MTGRDFDWVSERAKCSIGHAFEELKQDIQRDVQRRNGLRKGPLYAYEFETAVSGDIITVRMTGFGTTGNQRSVSFVLECEHISVRDTQNRLVFEATLTLNSEKECLFRVDHRETASWQLRMRALEPLFFADGVTGT